jgi:hypothetical protein
VNIDVEVTYDFWQLVVVVLLFGSALGFTRGFVEAWQNDRRYRKRIRSLP